MTNKVSEHPRALWPTAYDFINQNWNNEEQQWEEYNIEVKPTEPCFCRLQVVKL